MTARALRIGIGVLAVAALGSACGGSGGGGGGGLLPLLAADEFVCPHTAGTTSNELAACNAGPRIYVAWVERFSSDPDIVVFNRSLDGGATWFANSVLVSDATSDCAQVAIACDGDRVYLVYKETVAGVEQVSLNRSLDAGTTFLPAEVQVSDAAGQTVSGPVVCCEGLTVHVAWADDRNGARDIRYHRSTDGGATFAGPDLLIETDTPGATQSSAVSLCCDGLHVYAAWVDTRTGDRAVRLNGSVDGGVTFLVADVAVSHAPVATGNLGVPRAVCEGGIVAVVWSDERNGLGDIFANRSIDAGASFLGTDRRVDTDAPGAANSGIPVACLEDGVLHVAFADLRTGIGAVRYNRSADAGGTFLPQDVPLSDPPPGSDELGDLTMTCAGPAVAVAWQEIRTPPLDDVFVAVSTNGGSNFQEVRADTDLPGAALSFNPGLAIDGNHLTVVWHDVRGGSAQLRVNRTR